MNPTEDPDQNQVSQINNFVALKNLKQKEHEVAMMGNRIKVLEAHNQRNTKKMENSRQKMQQLASIRSAIVHQHKQAQLHKKTFESQLNKKSTQNKQNKAQHSQILKRNKQDIALKKHSNHSNVRSQHNKNQKKINEEIQKYKQQKLKKHNKVVCEQGESRIIINQYLNRKNISVHDSLAKQKESIYRKHIKKQKQLNNLAKKQLELIQKQSQSESAYKQMKNKLDVMLGKIRHQKRKKKESVIGNGKYERDGEDCA